MLLHFGDMSASSLPNIRYGTTSAVPCAGVVHCHPITSGTWRLDLSVNESFISAGWFLPRGSGIVRLAVAYSGNVKADEVAQSDLGQQIKGVECFPWYSLADSDGETYTTRPETAIPMPQFEHTEKP